MILFYILFLLINIFDAIGDALMCNKKWLVAKFSQMFVLILSISGSILLSTLLHLDITEWTNWVNLVLMFMFIRIGLFNVVWGIARFRVKVWYWYYLGTTSLWDRLLNWVIVKMGFPQKHFLFLLYMFFTAMSLFILTNGFYLIK